MPSTPQPELLDTYLVEKGLSDRAFGERIGESEITVNRLRRGLQWLRRDVALKIRKATKGRITAASFDDPARIRRQVKPRRAPSTNDERRSAGA
jgi:hypothetical protein